MRPAFSFVSGGAEKSERLAGVKRERESVNEARLVGPPEKVKRGLVDLALRSSGLEPLH